MVEPEFDELEQFSHARRSEDHQAEHDEMKTREPSNEGPTMFLPGRSRPDTCQIEADLAVPDDEQGIVKAPEHVRPCRAMPEADQKPNEGQAHECVFSAARREGSGNEHVVAKPGRE